jgi:hypothetical protein
LALAPMVCHVKTPVLIKQVAKKSHIYRIVLVTQHDLNVNYIKKELIPDEKYPGLISDKFGYKNNIEFYVL